MQIGHCNFPTRIEHTLFRYFEIYLKFEVIMPRISSKQSFVNGMHVIL